MIVRIKIGGIEFTVRKHNKYKVIALEFSKILAMLIEIQALHIMVEPDFPASKRTSSMSLQLNTIYRVLREKISPDSPAFDHQFAEILIKENLSQFWLRFQSHLYYFSLTVGISSKVYYLTSRLALCNIVLSLLGNTGYIKPLHIIRPILAVLIYDVVNCSCVRFLEYGDMNYFSLLFLVLRTFCFTNENFVCHTYHFVSTVLIEYNYIVDATAIFNKFIFLEPCSNKTLFPVNV